MWQGDPHGPISDCHREGHCFHSRLSSPAALQEDDFSTFPKVQTKVQNLLILQETCSSPYWISPKTSEPTLKAPEVHTWNRPNSIYLPFIVREEMTHFIIILPFLGTCSLLSCPFLQTAHAFCMHKCQQHFSATCCVTLRELLRTVSLRSPPALQRALACACSGTQGPHFGHLRPGNQPFL